MTVEQQVRAIVADELCAEPHEIDSGAKLSEFVHDSLDAMSLIFRIERELKVDLKTLTPHEVPTFGDLVRKVESAPPKEAVPA